VHELKGRLQQLKSEEVDEDLQLNCVEVGNSQSEGLGNGTVSFHLVFEGPHFLRINLRRVVFS